MGSNLKKDVLIFLEPSIYIPKSEFNYKIQRKIYELKQQYDDTLQKTKESFEPTLLSTIISYIKSHFLELLGPVRSNNPETIKLVSNEFDKIESIEDLFLELQYKYTSWFNYEFIVKLVKEFKRNNSLMIAWSSYKEKLEDYFINSGALLKDVDAVQFGITDVPPGTRVMIAKVDRDDYTPADLFFFRRAIPRELDVPEYNLYFSFVRIGSLCLGYLIPDYLYSLLFPLTPKLQQQLASIGITELTCGEYEYHLKEVS